MDLFLNLKETFAIKFVLSGGIINKKKFAQERRQASLLQRTMDITVTCTFMYFNINCYDIPLLE